MTINILSCGVEILVLFHSGYKINQFFREMNIFPANFYKPVYRGSDSVSFKFSIFMHLTWLTKCFVN